MRSPRSSAASLLPSTSTSVQPNGTAIHGRGDGSRRSRVDAGDGGLVEVRMAAFQFMVGVYRPKSGIPVLCMHGHMEF